MKQESKQLSEWRDAIEATQSFSAIIGDATQDPYFHELETMAKASGHFVESIASDAVRVYAQGNSRPYYGLKYWGVSSSCGAFIIIVRRY